MSTRQIFRSFRIESSGSRRERAERRRLRRIFLRDNWSIELWIVLIWTILAVLMAPRIAELHHEMHHPKAHQR